MSSVPTELSSSSALPPPDPVYTFRPYAGEVTAVQYVALPGARPAIVSGTTTGQLGLWELASKRQMWTVEGKDQIVSIKALHNSTKLLSQCRKGVVDLWDVESKTKNCSLAIGNPGFCRLAIAPAPNGASTDNGWFAVAHPEYGKVNLYDTQVQSLVNTFLAAAPKSKGMCMSVAGHRDVESGVVYFMGGFEDGSVLVWDSRRTDRELSGIKLFTEPVMCVDFSSLMSYGIAGSPLKQIEAFSLCAKEGQLESKYRVDIKNAGVADIAIRNDCKIFASGGWDGRIRVFGFKKGKPLAILNYHSATVNCLTFAGVCGPPEDKNILVCGSKDKRISLWKIY